MRKGQHGKMPRMVFREVLQTLCGKLQCRNKRPCGKQKSVTPFEVAVMFKGEKFGMIAHQYLESCNKHVILQYIA